MSNADIFINFIFLAPYSYCDCFITVCTLKYLFVLHYPKCACFINIYPLITCLNHINPFVYMLWHNLSINVHIYPPAYIAYPLVNTSYPHLSVNVHILSTDVHVSAGRRGPRVLAVDISAPGRFWNLATVILSKKSEKISTKMVKNLKKTTRSTRVSSCCYKNVV
jgi:hypothetical protein